MGLRNIAVRISHSSAARTRRRSRPMTRSLLLTAVLSTAALAARAPAHRPAPPGGAGAARARPDKAPRSPTTPPVVVVAAPPHNKIKTQGVRQGIKSSFAAYRPPFTLHGNLKPCARHSVEAGSLCFDYTANGKTALLRSAEPVMRIGGDEPRAEPNRTVYLELRLGGENKHGNGPGVSSAGPPLAGVIAVGLIPQNHDPSILPGLGPQSWGCHSDDGRCYAFDVWKRYARTWSVGDVVGIGVEPASRRVFFTINGVHRGVPFAPDEYDLGPDSSEQDIYLAVGVARGDVRFEAALGTFGQDDDDDAQDTGFDRAPAQQFTYPLDRELTLFERVSSIFTRFDRDRDGHLSHSEIKRIVRATAPDGFFTRADYVRFCHVTGAKTLQGLNVNSFFLLYELGYGDLDTDYATLTSVVVPEESRPAIPAVLTLTKGGMTAALQSGGAPIDIDGGWSDWGECTQQCGFEGVRKRTCTEPSPQGRGRDCVGDAVQPCNRFRCVQGARWTRWTRCSTTCGAGVQYRTCLSDSLSVCEGPSARLCKNPKPCNPEDYVHVDTLDAKARDVPKANKRVSIKLNRPKRTRKRF